MNITPPSSWISLAVTVVCAALLSLLPAQAQTASENAGPIPPNTQQPFVQTPVATFEYPWAIAFLPDGRMLVTEKAGRVFLVTQNADKTALTGVPKVYYSGQNGLLDIAIAPNFEQNHTIYFTYVEPQHSGGVLVLARAQLRESKGGARLQDMSIIWRQHGASTGGQPGGIIAFSRNGQHLFLTVGDRQDPQTAQNPDLARGKVLRLNLDGSTPSDNPMATEGGVRAQTWSTGHRNPYGLAFAPDGRLWLHEMGPRGGDELNLIQAGKNYGWPLVSNGDNYSGLPIPRHNTRPEFDAPVIYWTPVIAPAGLAFYTGDLFPQWRHSAFIGGLVAKGLVRIEFDDQGGARQMDRWLLGHRIRDVAVASDGAVWVIEDARAGRLLRLTPQH
ncbi:PQQ-dependent sugar dehydrogenase [Alcaligenaceae bacterium CGII-47]|nr:PQQ-dependent sugar dehydrogenase [Alcaligenaceae bacterium CGII-47]